MTGNRQRLLQVIPIFLLIISIPVFFSKILCAGKPLFGSDFVLQFYPWKRFIYEYVWSHGVLPFWNPYLFSGTPFMANIQASMFYPLGFLFYLMPTQQAYGYTIMLHCTLGAIFMYVFARSISVHKAGAFLAAIVFTYNGFFMGHLYAGHLTFVQNYIWIPLIFFYLHNFLKTPYFRYTILAGLFLGIQILGGFPQIAFYTILAIILFGAYHVGIRLKHGKNKTVHRLSCGMVIIVLFGFAMAAVQILPTYEFTQLSSRSGGVTYEFATTDSFDPVNLVTFLMPNFFGNPANGSYWKSSEYSQFWELCAYVGIGPLLLLCFLKKDAQTRQVQGFFVLLLLLALFLSLGRYNPLYRLIYQLPGFSHFRIPAQILYLYVFSLSILAGTGLNSLSRLESYSVSYRIMVIVGLLFFGVLILVLVLRPLHFFYHVLQIIRPSGLPPDLMPRMHEAVWLSLLTGAGFFVLVTGMIHLCHRHRVEVSWLIVMLLGVMTVDLSSFSSSLIRTTDLSVDQEKMQLVKALNNDPEIHRVVAMSDRFQPNDGLLYRYHDIQGYDPLILKRYLAYINRSQNMPACSEAVNVGYVTRLDNHLIRMLNVKYAISNNRGIWKLEDHMPRAFIVHKARTLPSEEVLDFMMSHDFDPKELMLLEESQQMRNLSQQDTVPTEKELNHEGENGILDSSFERCHILDYRMNEIKLTVNMNAAGYLVLSELNYPGWKAYVNGKKCKILTGNYIFRVLPLSKGDQDISVRFEPDSFKIGLIISAASILFLLLFTFSLLVRKKMNWLGAK